jgi:general stress protein 26
MKLDNNQDLKSFKDLVTNIETGIFITRLEKDKLMGRKLSTTEVDENGHLWFFTEKQSDQLNEVSKNNEVYIIYESEAHNTYMVVTGTASLSTDKNKINKLYGQKNLQEKQDIKQLSLLMVIPSHIEI